MALMAVPGASGDGILVDAVSVIAGLTAIAEDRLLLKQSIFTHHAGAQGSIREDGCFGQAMVRPCERVNVGYLFLILHDVGIDHRPCAS